MRRAATGNCHGSQSGSRPRFATKFRNGSAGTNGRYERQRAENRNTALRLEQQARDRLSDLGVPEDFDRLNKREQEELALRIERGENADDVLEELAVRHYNDLPATEPTVRGRANLNYIPGFENETNPAGATEGGSRVAPSGRDVNQARGEGGNTQEGGAVRKPGEAASEVTSKGSQAGEAYNISPSTIKHVRRALKAGGYYEVHPDTIRAVHDQIAPILGIVPEGIPVATLSHIERVSDGRYLGYYETSDGRTIRLPLAPGLTGDFFIVKGLYWPGKGVFINWFELPRGDIDHSLRSVVYHEALHVLRSESNGLGGAFNLFKRDFARLLRHANALGILDMPFAQHAMLIGDPQAYTYDPNITIRQMDEKVYQNLDRGPAGASAMPAVSYTTSQHATFRFSLHYARAYIAGRRG